MKTAARENPHWAINLSNRAPGAEDQNRSCLHKWAAKQEKLQPLELCFFLTSPFRELTRHNWYVDSGTGARDRLVGKPSKVMFFQRGNLMEAKIFAM
jgi:hypothetical protein